jgi:hypothetical protein
LVPFGQVVSEEKIKPEALKSLYRSPGLEGPLFFMPIGNPRWLPPQVIVLTQDHIGKIQKYLLL